MYAETTDINNQLNSEQLKAVTSEPKNLLILAGAGSGKTRVLVHRIVWLIQAQQVSPHSILAVTFTNKAAKEMQQRIEKLLHVSARSLWIGTFHGLAHRLLRLHWKLANLPQNFQILDSDDQLRIIKRIHKDLNIENNRLTPKQSQYYINKQKDEGIRFNNLPKTREYIEKYNQEIYRLYENHCNQLGLVDFAEILLRSKELFINHPELNQHYQNRFKHILVDEFQDTNNLQYNWLKLFYKKDHNYFTMVGDDDQSIYGWRGANVDNIKKFAKDYTSPEVIRLEQNYRSTANILKAANSLISNNFDRMGKNLWTDGVHGEKISIYHAFNDIDEAVFVVNKIKQFNQEDNISLKDMAILYRANHQSRQFEEQLLKSNIAYKIYGGQRFYERMEIKDALAYLRLVANPLDDAAFDRIINWPARGIGKQTLLNIREYAQSTGLSLWHASKDLLDKNEFKSKAKTSITDFIKLISDFNSYATKIGSIGCHNNLSALVENLIEHSGLRDFYYKDDKSKNKTRVENLDELISAVNVFEQDFNNNSDLSATNQESAQNLSVLQVFLDHVVLESGEVQAKDHQDSLNLMTVHTAKGLEFKLVFVVGLEEGLFPHEMCLSSEDELAEERRLCYVAITRAMNKLFLSFCEKRRMRGEEYYNLPSRFLQELPKELLEEHKADLKISYNNTNISTRTNNYENNYKNSYKTSGTYNLNKSNIKTSQSDLYPIGSLVKHSIFGQGVVLHTEGDGEQMRVQVKFERPHGTKMLVAKIAKLELVS